MMCAPSRQYKDRERWRKRDKKRERKRKETERRKGSTVSFGGSKKGGRMYEEI